VVFPQFLTSEISKWQVEVSSPKLWFWCLKQPWTTRTLVWKEADFVDLMAELHQHLKQTIAAIAIQKE
jgi:hypothetical protein